MSARIPLRSLPTSADVEAVAKAFGFESAKHLDDVLAGRRPSALAEPSVWRDRARRAGR